MRALDKTTRPVFYKYQVYWLVPEKPVRWYSLPPRRFDGRKMQQMETGHFTINKHINKPVEFKGFKAQYIWWLGAGLVILLILFVILYFSGVNSFVCLAIVGIIGGFLFHYVFAVSNKHGEYGLMKTLAKKRIPKVISSRSRTIFLRLNKKNNVK